MLVVLFAVNVMELSIIAQVVPMMRFVIKKMVNILVWLSVHHPKSTIVVFVLIVALIV